MKSCLLQLMLSAIGIFPADQAIDYALIVLFLFLGGYSLFIGQVLYKQWYMKLLSSLVVLTIAGSLVALKSLPLFH